MVARAPKRRSESGSAVVEFLAGGLLLLIPVVYLILTFAQVQAATYAAEAASREVARVYVRAQSVPEARSRAAVVTRMAFSDQGIDVAPHEILRVTCEDGDCLAPGSSVHVAVDLEVPLPLIPDVVARNVPTSVAVSADAYATIDRFGG